MYSVNPQYVAAKPLSLAIAITVATIASQATAETLMLEEVIVTAQKRAESLQDVPMSISAVTEDMIAVAGIETLDDVQMLVPSLNIYKVVNPAFASISIRGVGTGASDPTLEPSVGVFIDGVFMPRSVFGLSQLVDVERIEVLMGPQGTLYGKNTNAGVISVSTKGMPDQLEGSAELTAGNYDLWTGKVSIGGLVTDDLGYRFGALVSQRDGWMENELTGKEDYNDVDNQAFRGQIFWNPGEKLSTRFIGYYSENEGKTGPEQGIGAGTLAESYFTDISAAAGIPAPKWDTGDRETQGAPGESRLEVKGASVHLDYELDSGVTLTSITAQQEWEIGDQYYENILMDAITPLALHDPIDEEVFTQEFRVTSPGGETVDWMVGAYYFDSELHRGTTDNSPDKAYSVYVDGLPGIPDIIGLGLPGLIVPGDTATWQTQTDTESWALYGQGSYNFTEQTSLTVGLRYGEEEKDFEMSLAAYDANGVLFNWDTVAALGGDGSYTGGSWIPLVGGPLTNAQNGQFPSVTEHRVGDRKEDNVTGMISLKHFINDHMLYGTVSTGVKGGGFNGTFGSISIDDREFDSEETTSYEVGAKLEGLLDGRARLNLAYFYTEFDDFQAATWDPETVTFLVDNAGKQVTQGIELDGTWLATERLTLTANILYMDAEYKDHEGANCSVLSSVPIEADGSCDLSGYDLEFAPEWGGNVAADYVQPMAGGDFYGRLSMSFKSEHITDPTRPDFATAEYEVWNARLGWRNENWDISLWGKNITDEDFSRFDNANFFGGLFESLSGGDTNNRRLHQSYLNEPATYGVTARYSF
jgi:iron complex outermembrane receptor protein